MVPLVGLRFAGDVPFQDVYCHSVIQAPDGRRMSKSLGTGIDPRALIDGETPALDASAFRRLPSAADLGAHGAMTALLADALAPNLVQTLEGNPAFVHGGPFANIAHGCNSVTATNTALAHADWVVTEAGFGADLGAEKFIDLKCRFTGLRPDAAVLVATIRSMKYHGGVTVTDLTSENVDAMRSGMSNIERHLHNLREVWGLPVVVGLNRFPSDTDAEIAAKAAESEARIREIEASAAQSVAEVAKSTAEAIVAALGVALLIYGLAFKNGVAGTRLILIGIGLAAALPMPFRSSVTSSSAEMKVV